MKIELNPNRMTVPELTDCINELIAQRDRLLEEERQFAEEQCHDAMIQALGQVWEYTETGNFDATLYIQNTSGRTHRIPLNMRAVAEWHIDITRKPQS